MKIILALIFPLVLGWTTAHAGIEIQKFDDPEKQATYKTLVAELRCLVCQNQNLADSNAELAVDLRTKVYEMIESGSSRAEIVDFMVARYGDFVLYRPPVQANTLILWIGPFILLLIGLGLAFLLIRRQLLNNDNPEEESK